MLNSSSTNADSFILDGFDDKVDVDELSHLNLDTQTIEHDVTEPKAETK